MVVQTKDELKKAIAAKEETIVVVGSLQKKLERCDKVFRLTSDKKKKIIKVFAGMGAASIAGLVAAVGFAPVTGGASMLVYGLTSGGGIATAAASTGVAAPIIAAAIALIGMIGLENFVFILKNYEPQTTTTTIKVGETEFTRSTTYRKKDKSIDDE